LNTLSLQVVAVAVALVVVLAVLRVVAVLVVCKPARCLSLQATIRSLLVAQATVVRLNHKVSTAPILCSLLLPHKVVVAVPRMVAVDLMVVVVVALVVRNLVLVMVRVSLGKEIAAAPMVEPPTVAVAVAKAVPVVAAWAAEAEAPARRQVSVVRLLHMLRVAAFKAVQRERRIEETAEVQAQLALILPVVMVVLVLLLSAISQVR
jgi:hypothetical protein